MPDIQKDEKKEEAPKASVDPFMAELAGSFQQTIDSEVKFKPMAPLDLEEKATFTATQTVGEVVAEEKRRAESGAGKVDGEKSKAEQKTSNIEHRTSNAEVKEKPAAKEEAAQVQVKARKQEPLIVAPASPAVTVTIPAKETPKEEAKAPVAPVVDEYEKSLSDGQREELEMARAAEKFLPEQYRGQPEKLVGFFKKVDEFARSHPDLAPESEEFKEFVVRSRPAYREGDRRRVERMQIKAEVLEENRKEFDQKLAKEREERERSHFEMKEKPLVAKTLSSFQDGLLGQVPKEMDQSLAEVGKVLQEEGFEEAARKFPVEAPIYESTVQTAGEYLELAHGLKQFNPEDPTHKWLVSFIERQADVIRGDPERRVQNGKEFLPVSEFAELAMKDAQAARKHWTFSEQQILDMLALNAHLMATNRIKELEAAGFKRNAERGTRNGEQGKEKQETGKAEVSSNGKSAAEQGQPAPRELSATEVNETVSPRAGTTGAPGVATGAPNVSENAQFMERLVPGGGKFAG